MVPSNAKLGVFGYFFKKSLEKLSSFDTPADI